MKLYRTAIVTFIITLCFFSSAIYMSCNKKVCQGVHCANGGTCSEGTCSCPSGWTGTRCEQLNMPGTWSGVDACSDSMTHIVMMIDSTSGNFTNLTVNNPGGFGSEVQIQGTLSSSKDTFAFSGQKFDSLTMSGIIVLTGSRTCIINYTLSNDTSGFVDICSGTYTKE